jgi:hypothetical protein
MAAVECGLTVEDEPGGGLLFRVKQTGDSLKMDAAMVARLHRVLSGNCPCCRGWRFDNMSGRWMKDRR